MNRETELVRDITKETRQGLIHWSNVAPSRYAEFIFQSVFAYQAFDADYTKNDKNYQFVLVHKKAPSHNTDFEIIEERHSTELLVLNGGRLLSTLTDYDIDEQYLDDLSATVAEHNKDINDLFE